MSSDQVIRPKHWETYEGLNLYGFVQNDPVTLIDNNGFWTVGIGVSGNAVNGVGPA